MYDRGIDDRLNVDVNGDFLMEAITKKLCNVELILFLW